MRSTVRMIWRFGLHIEHQTVLVDQHGKFIFHLFEFCHLCFPQCWICWVQTRTLIIGSGWVTPLWLQMLIGPVIPFPSKRGFFWNRLLLCNNLVQCELMHFLFSLPHLLLWAEENKFRGLRGGKVNYCEKSLLFFVKSFVLYGSGMLAICNKVQKNQSEQFLKKQS